MPKTIKETSKENRIEKAAAKLIAVLDDVMKDLPAKERDRRWKAFSRAVRKVGRVKRKDA